MKDTAAAGNYAKALFGAIADKKKSDPDLVLKQLTQVAGLISGNASLDRTLQNPLLTPARKKEQFKKETAALSGGFAPELNLFFDLLIAKKRVALLPLILTQYEKLLDESRGRVKAQVRSALALEDKDRRDVEEQLSRRFNRKVALEVSVDPDLLAGMVIRVGDLVIDNSLKTQLKNLRTRIAGA